jgi:hypothetical protein
MAKRRKKIKHPIFGSIDYSTGGLPSWEGQVSVPFFAAYDLPPLLDVYWPACRLGPDPKEGLFYLVILDEAGTGPTQAQERAFVHFQENQDVICATVVAAIFQHYQEEYQNFEVPAPRPSKAAIEALLPALEGAEGLQRLIRFNTLYVLEGMVDDYSGGATPETLAKVNHWSLLGFAFSCTWDVEHKLGVVFHRDKVVQVNGSDITWNGPNVDDF